MNNKAVINNFLWRFLERIGVQGVNFIVSIIVARIVAPEVYGIVALVTIFTTIMQVFIDSGLGTALIQKKNADDLDFSTVFYFNLLMCVALYGVMYLLAPFIASFYEIPQLTKIVRVLSITLIVSGVRGIQQSYVSKKLQFKKFFFSTLGATLFSAVVGIYMAYKGYGVWALVGQTVSSNVVGTIILWITVEWRPKWMFSFSRLKGLFSYGWKLLVSALIDTVYREIRSLIIGKRYSSESLAFYNKGQQFPKLLVDNINTSIDSVLLPTMSNEQENKERVKMMTRRAIKTGTYIIAPLMIGLAAVAEPFIELLLTSKWLFCVPFLRIFCLTYMIYPIHTANLNAIKAMGRSDMFLKLEIIKKIIGIIALAATMMISVEAMAYSLLGTTVIGSFVNAFPNKKLLNYSYLEQIKDIAPSLVLCAVMGFLVYSVKFLGFSSIITLFVQIPLGAAIYIIGSKLFRLESFNYALSTVKNYLRKG